MTRKWWTAVPAALAAMVLIAACGSSSGSAGDSANPDAKVRIGLIYGLSGSEGSTNVAGAAVATAWEKWVNDNGGVAGQKVDVIVKDTRTDPATALAAAKELVTKDKVAGLMVADNATDSTIQDYISKSGVPMIGGTSYTWTNVPNAFPVNTQIPVTLTGDISVAKAIGASSFGGISCGEVPSCASAADVSKPVAAQVGIPFAGWALANASDANYAAQCVSLKNAGYINLVTSPAVSARVITDCIQQGFKGTFGICCVSFSQKGNANVTPGTRIAGLLDGFPWWADAPPVQQFRDVLAKYAPGQDYTSTSATTAWTSLELFRKTMTKAGGDITAKSTLAAYKAISNETLDGLLATPLTFTGAPKANNCFWGFNWTVGDKNPTLVKAGASGNGASGDLQSTCP